jgi:hypothetical protein
VSRMIDLIAQFAATFVRYFTPLCPAGHLPLKEGDWLASTSRQIVSAAREASASKPLISPLEGEMSGRTEGGAGLPALTRIRRGVR